MVGHLVLFLRLIRLFVFLLFLFFLTFLWGFIFEQIDKPELLQLKDNLSLKENRRVDGIEESPLQTFGDKVVWIDVHFRLLFKAFDSLLDTLLQGTDVSGSIDRKTI